MLKTMQEMPIERKNSKIYFRICLLVIPDFARNNALAKYVDLTIMLCFKMAV